MQCHLTLASFYWNPSYAKEYAHGVIVKISVPGIKDEFEAYLPARQRQTAGIWMWKRHFISFSMVISKGNTSGDGSWTTWMIVKSQIQNREIYLQLNCSTILEYLLYISIYTIITKHCIPNFVGTIWKWFRFTV